MTVPIRKPYAGEEARTYAASRSIRSEAEVLQRAGQTLTEIAQALNCDRSIIVQVLYHDRVRP